MKVEMKSAKITSSTSPQKPSKTTVKPRIGVPKAKDPAMQRWLNKWAGILTPEGAPRLAKMARVKK